MNRKKSAIIRITAYSITAVILLAVLILGLTGHLFTGSFTLIGISTADNYKNAGEYTAGGASILGDDVREIDINWIDGTIDVSVYDGDTIQFSETSGKKLSEEKQLYYLKKNGVLTIQYKKSEASAFSFFSFGGSLRKNLEMKIPRSVAENLKGFDIDAVSAESRVTGIHAEEISFDGTSGDASIEDCTAKKLDFDTTSGSFTGTDVEISGKLSINTTSGSADVSGSVGSIDFDTVSGSLTSDTSNCPKSVVTSTVSGSVTLNIPENDGFTYYKDTVSGSFNCDFPLTQKDDKGSYKDGSADFNFDSVSGSFEIRKR